MTESVSLDGIALLVGEDQPHWSGPVPLEFREAASRMVPACQRAFELVGDRTLAHDGAPVYSDQVMSAAPLQSGEGWRLSKGKLKRKVDAAIALVTMCDRATTKPEPEPTVVEPFIIFP